MIPRRFFWLFDAIALAIAFAVGYQLTPGLSQLLTERLLPEPVLAVLGAAPGSNLDHAGGLVWILVLVAPITIVILGALGNHHALLYQSWTRIVIGPVTGVVLALGLVMLAGFALQLPERSRVFVFTFAFTGALLLVAYRVALRLYFQRRAEAGAYARNVLVVGNASGVEWMLRYLTENVTPTAYRAYGYLQVNGQTVQTRPDGVYFLGTVDRLGELLIHRPIHEVIAVHPPVGGSWIDQVIEDCDSMGTVLRIVPEALLAARRTLRSLYPLEPLNLPAIVLQPAHLDPEALFVKRLMDIAVSSILLVVLSPVMLATALAIKITTPGLPVLYPWRVVGQNGVEFTGYKFTTMYHDADERKKDLLAHNEMQGPVFKMRNDPRVTPLGRYLRKFSLNELPQLWSVLRGDMSLVGPRPAFRSELERYEFWHKRKLSIKPGITCLWQVRGRNRISDFDDWVRMDLEYIDNWSLWLDVKTLVRTAWVVLAGSGS